MDSWSDRLLLEYFENNFVVVYRLAFFCLQPPPPKGTAEILTGIGHYRVG